MNNVEQILSEAYKLFEDKEFDASLQKVEEANNLLDQVPEDKQDEKYYQTRSGAENLNGFNYLSKQEIEKARECYEKSLEYNPNSSQGCAGLGEVFYLCKMDYEAKVMFEWAIDYNPNNQFAIAELAKVNKSLALPENHNTLNVGTTLKKGTLLYKGIGEAYQSFYMGDYEKALEKLGDVEKVFEFGILSNDTKHKIASLENFRGFNLLALQRIDEAQEAFEKALNMNPDSSQACAGLGEVFYLKKDENKSKTMFEWGVKNNPQNVFAIEGLAKVNNLLGLDETNNSIVSN